MKTLILTVAVLFSSSLLHSQIRTPPASPGHEFTQTVGFTEITVNYSRPGVKGRTIFAKDGLVPYGEMWRTGANAAPWISFDRDVTFQGVEVKAGKYAIYTLPNAESWDVMLYKDLDLFADFDNYDETKEVLSVKVKPVELQEKVESFTIELGDLKDGSAMLSFKWDKTRVPIELKVNTEQEMADQISQFENDPMNQVSRNYLNVGWYLFASAKDKEKALSFIEKGLEMTTSDFKFFHMHRKAMIQADLGDYKGALKTANAALENGKNAPDNAKEFYEQTSKSEIEASIAAWTEMK